MIFGVAGGLARRFGLAPNSVRLLFVLAGLVVFGVILYLAAAVAWRNDDDPQPNSKGRQAIAVVGTGVGVAYGLIAVSPRIPHAPLLVFLALLATGATLVLGRRPEQQGESVSGSMVSRRQVQPPTLLLLTMALASIAATATWLIGRQDSGTEQVGAVAAAALIAIGLGVATGAWRGRSHILGPVGVVLAAPLTLAAFAGVQVQVGQDDPRTLKPGAAERTYVLGAGSGPVTVTRSVGQDIRRLTIRKASGTIDLRLSADLPARITVASVGGNGYISGIASTPGIGSKTYTLAATGPQPLRRAPLAVRIETATGSVAVSHDVIGSGRPVANAIPAQRASVRDDLAARRTLLRSEEATLARFQSRYRTALARLANAPVDVDPRVLAIDESRWYGGDAATSNWLRTRDPAIATAGSLSALRFDLLRAAWRANSVRRGIREQEKLLAALGGTAPISTPPRPASPGGLGSGPDAPPTAAPAPRVPSPPIKERP